jgi:hypothetical protein
VSEFDALSGQLGGLAPAAGDAAMGIGMLNDGLSGLTEDQAKEAVSSARGRISQAIQDRDSDPMYRIGRQLSEIERARDPAAFDRRRQSEMEGIRGQFDRIRAQSSGPTQAPGYRTPEQIAANERNRQSRGQVDKDGFVSLGISLNELRRQEADRRRAEVTGPTIPNPGSALSGPGAGEAGGKVVNLSPTFNNVFNGSGQPDAGAVRDFEQSTLGTMKKVLELV